VTTKIGDSGLTLGPGMKKIGKDSIDIDFLGNLDELNAHIGLIVLEIQGKELKQIFHKIQNQIFNIGANFFNRKEDRMDYMIEFLEKNIQEKNANLPDLTSFLLPQGSHLVQFLHICRCIARRAERSFWASGSEEKKIGIYLNRLSDFIFVIIRNQKDAKLWDPSDI
jgi:cob(I)alamin adenosyltransferase